MSGQRLKGIGTIVTGLALGFGYYYISKAYETKEFEKTKRQENRVAVMREGMEYVEQRRQEKTSKKEESRKDLKDKIAKVKEWTKEKNESSGSGSD